MIYVAAFLLLTTTVFGILWLREMQAHDETEIERDELQDQLHDL